MTVLSRNASRRQLECVLSSVHRRDWRTVAATCNLEKRRTTRAQVRGGAASRLAFGITDSRRECDKYNGGTRTDGAGSNPVGLENLSSVCRYYSRHPLLGRRIKRDPPPPSASGLVSSSPYGGPMFPDLSPPLCFRFCKLRKLRTGVGRERAAGSKSEALSRRLRIAIYSATFDKSWRCCFG